MVSLQPNQTNTGASFFVDSSSAALEGTMDDDRQEFLDPILSTGNEENFKPLRTIPAFSFHLLISFAISATGIFLAAVWDESKRCEAYFIMLYLRAAFWMITFIFNHIIKHHHEKLRMNGYHDFHRSTSVLKGVPLYIVSLWNTAILTVQTFLQHYYGPNFAIHCIQSLFSPVVYISTFSIAESVVLAIVNGYYIVRVSEFNKLASPPDALRGSHSIGGSVGLTQRGADMTELLEKQADLIDYLKVHNYKLNQKLMQLNAQVRTVSIS